MTEQKIIKRFDTFTIPKVHKTKEGFIRGSVIASKIGVFDYLNFDNSIRKELRHPDEVFKTDSLETIKMIPITDDHPPEFVTANNADKYQVGYTGENYTTDGENVIVTITITHKDTIDKILSGKKVELSLGYEVVLVKESGNFDNCDYQYRQTNIVYNHLALVHRGRAGRNARIRFDSSAELITTNIKKGNMSENIQNLDQEIEIKNLRIDSLISEKSLLTHKLEDVQKKLDHVEKAWEKTRKELEEEKKIRIDSVIEERVIERVALFAKAMPFLKDETMAYLHHTDREIMEAAMNSTRTDRLDFSDKSDDYVKGMFATYIGENLKTKNIDSRSIFKVLSQKCDANINSSIHSQILNQLQTNYNKGKK